MDLTSADTLAMPAAISVYLNGPSYGHGHRAAHSYQPRICLPESRRPHDAGVNRFLIYRRLSTIYRRLVRSPLL
ncbi:hypothetical protein M3625_25150 [Paenibacillus sp. MER 78]|nr:hypothetical protein [Paenibacillus sp. MER 78]